MTDEMQVEIDGLTLGGCLAVERRLAQFPNFKMQGLRTGLTEKQQAAVDAYYLRLRGSS